MGDRTAEPLTPADLEARVLAALGSAGPKVRSAVVAVSGGTDSLALLHLLAGTRDRHGLSLHVVHVDHGIHPNSEAVAEEVAAAARDLGLPVRVVTLGLGEGTTETAAREARYRILDAERERAGAEVILTAHQQDDQVETVLMRVLRGTGSAGLAGMAQRQGRLVRPLLDVTRDELSRYLAERGLSAWDDPANRSSEHLRSWIRTELLPVLRGRLPDVEQRLLDLAGQAAVERAAWDALPPLVGLDVRAERDGLSVDSGRLRAYDSRLALTLVMVVSRRAGAPVGLARARRILELVQGGKSGGRVDLGSGWVAENRFDRVAILPPRQNPAEPGPALVAGPEPAGEVQWGPWRLRWGLDRAPGHLSREGWVTWLMPGQYQVAGCGRADRIRPLGGTGRRLVVRCMQDQRIGRSERPGWPLVSFQGAAVWVPGVCRGADRVPAPGTEAVRLDVEYGEG